MSLFRDHVMKKPRVMILLTFVLHALLSITSAAQAGVYDTPPQDLRSFEDLRFPPFAPKSELQWMLQTIVDQLDQKAFVDFGDQSDLMHVHLILRPLSDSLLTPGGFLPDPSWTPPWDSLEPLAALIHTQEYPGARGLRPYTNRSGIDLHPFDRNQLLFLKDSVYGKRGEIINALGFREKPPVQGKKTPTTIRSDDLKKDFAGPNAGQWEYSFYFYRVKCSGFDAFMAVGGDIERSSGMELKVNGERACVNLLSFRCRTTPDDKKYCPAGFALSPYYTKDGLAAGL